jgi:LmbE family N-acetylglucosaminyl deacetylase
MGEALAPGFDGAWTRERTYEKVRPFRCDRATMSRPIRLRRSGSFFERYKTDILVVMAHPDDDTAISSYLARAVFDEGRKVAVIFTTRGEGGANEYGYETGEALGYIRENEARRALAALDVLNVWFLDGKNVGGGVLNSLASWPHGQGLESLVRLIRLTHPEVILTWLPASLPGDHSDHQAAGVVATEAFGLAGNPTIFPEQVSPAINPSQTAHHGRGLIDGIKIWQAKKLYFFSDSLAFDRSGKGPRYAASDISRSRKISYEMLARTAANSYASQGGVSAYLSHEFPSLSDPVEFVLGKTLVKSTTTGDIFEGIEPGPIPVDSTIGYDAAESAEISVRLGNPWAFYDDFWLAQGLKQLRDWIEPRMGVRPGGSVAIPLVLNNNTPVDQEITLTSRVPRGWTEAARPSRFRVKAHDSYAMEVFVTAPARPTESSPLLTWEATTDRRSVGAVSIRLHAGYPYLPQ